MQPVQFSLLNGLDAPSPVFFFSMGWMQQDQFSFLNGLDATSLFFFSRWAGCNQSVFLFSMGWMQPLPTSPFLSLDWLGPRQDDRGIKSRDSRRQDSRWIKKVALVPFKKKENWTGCIQPIGKRKTNWVHPAHRETKTGQVASVSPKPRNRHLFCWQFWWCIRQ